MRKFWSILVLLATAATLSACGGSTDQFATAPAGSSAAASATVAKLSVASSTPTLPPDGTTATITVTATDANNVAVSGAIVTFATSAGTLAVTSATTNSTGQATATLTAPGVAAGTTITVTAGSGTASGKATITVANSQQTLTLATSVPQIPSNGSSAATITATLQGASNNAISGATVNFSSDSGIITGAPATTNTSGKATVQLGSGQGNYQNRTITVTATSGSSTATIKVQVIGTSLSLTGPSSLVLGASGTFTVSLADSGGAGISGQQIALSSANGNTIPALVTTSSTGQATFTFTGAVSGADTITATALGQTATAAITVSAQSFAFTAPAANAQIPIGTSTAVTVKWTNGSGAPVVGHTITFASTRGTLSPSPATATTAADGTATVNIQSSSGGPATLQATTDTNVTTTSIVDFIATTPNAFSLQASPNVVSLSGQSTITATVRDANDNLVPNQTVDFSLTDVTGGSLSVASAMTNGQGQATTVYTATNTASATNGVSITGSLPSFPAITAPAATLTVGGQAVFLSLGTGNTIAIYSPTQFLMPFTVQAVDASGNPVANLAITFSVRSLGYGKGHWVSGTPWTQTFSTNAADPDVYTLSGISGCQTEDTNGNGVLDAGEDYNGNGVLDPGSVANTATLQGTFGGVTLNQSSTTGADGTAGVSILYPQDHAAWVAVQLTASATVQGTQSSTSTKFWLPMLAADVAGPSVTPPGQVSPYGVGTTCLNPN
ncbi:MAG TPA: Ig-like domain-containing protein [Steroidobacteraceae bacterium]|nr:Ig-like domain-containing protein [Steroidobacteraceae bacterium]